MEGTALAGVDYTHSSGELSWDSNEQNTKTFNVQLLNRDRILKNNMFLFVVLNSTNASISSSSSTLRIDIIDDDTGNSPFFIFSPSFANILETVCPENSTDGELYCHCLPGFSGMDSEGRGNCEGITTTINF